MLKGPSTSPSRISRYAPAVLAVGVPFLAYLLTLYPGVGDRQGTGDAIEYQLVGHILSIPHEPGYPQYVLLSCLWSLLPLPLSLAVKINLLSAIFTVVAGFFFFSAARSLSGSVTASVMATWLVLISPKVWLLSTQAEVYTLHLMWVSAVLWAALTWYDTGQQKYLVVLFLFYALSFGNHLTMITLLPGLAYLILARDPRVVRRWQNWGWGALAILAGLTQYTLLLWRSYVPHPALLPRFPRQASLSELFSYITGSRFVDRHFLKTGFEGWLTGIWDALVFSIDQLTLPFALLCGFGLFVSLRQHRQQTIFLALIGGSVVAFAAAYGIKDSLLYTIPAWLCAGLLGAAGLGRLLTRNRRWRLQITVTIALLLATLITWRGAQLRVVDNPTELASVIAVAEPGSGILAAFKQRRARLLRLYYQYGQVTDKASQLDFRSVNEVMATGLEDAADQPLYFRDPRTAKQLARALIDHRLLGTSPEGHPIYATTGQEPIRLLGLRPLWNDSLSLTLRDRSLDLTGDHTLHLFFFSSKHGRSKGYLPIEIQSDLDWIRSVDNALSIGGPDDFFLLVVPPLTESPRSALTNVLESKGLDIDSLPPSRLHTVVWWRVGSAPGEILLRSDLDEELTLTFDNPGAATGLESR